MYIVRVCGNIQVFIHNNGAPASLPLPEMLNDPIEISQVINFSGLIRIKGS